MPTYRCHLEMGTLSYKRSSVLMHRACTIQSLARGHVSCENKIININRIKNPIEISYFVWNDIPLFLDLIARVFLITKFYSLIQFLFQLIITLDLFKSIFCFQLKLSIISSIFSLPPGNPYENTASFLDHYSYYQLILFSTWFIKHLLELQKSRNSNLLLDWHFPETVCTNTHYSYIKYQNQIPLVLNWIGIST